MTWHAGSSIQYYHFGSQQEPRAHYVQNEEGQIVMKLLGLPLELGTAATVL